MDSNGDGKRTNTEALEKAAETLREAQLPQVRVQPQMRSRQGMSVLSMFLDKDTHTRAWQVAKMYADSALVPDSMRGNVGDCLITLAMADQLGENPITLMQSIYFVGGKAGWSAQYMIARANSSGVFRGSVKWRVEVDGKVGQYQEEKVHPSIADRDNIKVTAYATLAETGDEVSLSVSLRDAYREGWASRKGNKYATLPELMLRYRSATFLIRTHAPQVMFGMHTVDELHDMGTVEVSVSQERKPSAGHDALRQAVGVSIGAEDAEVVETRPEPAQAPAKNPFQKSGGTDDF